MINNKAGETKEFSSIRKAAVYVNMHYTYLNKCIKNDNIYKGEI